MAAYGGKFCTSVSVLFAVFYVSSSPLHDFNFQFLFGSPSNKFTTTEKLHRKNITGQLIQIRVFKKIRYIAVWFKNFRRLSKDGKQTVKKDVHRVLSSSNFSGPFYQVSRQFGNLFFVKIFDL